MAGGIPVDRIPPRTHKASPFKGVFRHISGFEADPEALLSHPAVRPGWAAGRRRPMAGPVSALQRPREPMDRQGAAALVCAGEDPPEVARLAQMVRQVIAEVEEEQPGRHPEASEDLGILF